MIALFRRALGKLRRADAGDLPEKVDHRAIVQSDELRNRFTEIYERNLWNSAESGSGIGSEVGFTQNLREWLVRKLPEYGVKRLVDAPCGDFNWMKLVVPQLDIDYLGLDIVESVVAANREQHGSERARFVLANLCEDALPAADLIMVRDCLFHLSYADTDRVLRNLARTDYKYLLTTTHVADGQFANSDISNGDFRLIDLYSAPYCFDPAKLIEAVDDYPPDFPIPRQMLLYAKADVPTGLQFT